MTSIAVAAANEPVAPIPLAIDLDRRKVALGDKLFHDPQLSRDGSISCASCHVLSLGGVDRRQQSIGIDGLKGDFNAPTILNSVFNFRQFWDGRVETLEEQIDGPVHDSREMDSNWPEIAAKLKADRDYRQQFRQIYARGIVPNSIRNAIATYESSLITPNSRFDRFLRGDKKSLSITEKEGYQRFQDYGCISCHQGVNLGGNMFQSFGIFGDYFADRGEINKADLGRYNVTQKESDRYVFKVPSLRNIARTSPYFHDGSVESLAEAVKIMGRYQLGRSLKPNEIDKIVQFLNTLTGELPN
ncbi:cytochrome-c peroxidase [Roseofilum casamattae]|uniref:Cytochrome-c peroxidase n=1 Tax=Roseofilum casamattae BLCC-M143 TaxID=3022442 RepID=A0ABT7BTC1_9CYAN|nr:cytochrome-c peroxidase [Roseofilum casamattae]MDJ1182429.1 cytochrome-c peroxidase [Roseofilum casamattae BLCC-M143]